MLSWYDGNSLESHAYESKLVISKGIDTTFSSVTVLMGYQICPIAHYQISDIFVILFCLLLSAYHSVMTIMNYLCTIEAMPAAIRSYLLAI